MSLDFYKGQLPQTPEEVPRFLLEFTQRIEEAFAQLHETGVWTPVLSDGTNNAPLDSKTNGRFTRIDDLIFFKGRLVTTSLGSVSGDVQINGLPFTSIDTTAHGSSVTIGRAIGLVIVAGQVIGGIITTDTTFVTLKIWDSTVGSTNMTATQWSATGDAVFSGHYYIRPRI